MVQRAALLSIFAPDLGADSHASELTLDEPTRDRLWELAHRVADAWPGAPNCSPRDAHAWSVLAATTARQVDRLRQEIEIEFVDDDPYPDLEAISADVLERARLKVWTGASEHPLWSKLQNWQFRSVHDLLPHVAKERPIDFIGEVFAFYDHARVAPDAARIALFTEVVVYACIYYTQGAFPDVQKTPVFPAFLEEMDAIVFNADTARAREAR